MTKIENMQYLLCGCIEGYFLCPEAVRLWNLYSLYDNLKFYKKADYYRRKYDRHFKEDKLNVSKG